MLDRELETMGYESAETTSSLPLSNLKGELGETALVKRVSQIRGEIVLKTPAGSGTNGADIISFNVSTGKVTLWDAKFRSAARLIQKSETFKSGKGDITDIGEVGGNGGEQGTDTNQ
jgi:hypothetical protein